jgi:hypothetical protein
MMKIVRILSASSIVLEDEAHHCHPAILVLRTWRREARREIDA